MSYLRERVYFAILAAIVCIGFVAYIPSVTIAYYVRLWDIIVVDTLFTFWILYLLFHPPKEFRSRVIGLVTSIYLLSTFLIFKVGPFGAGYIWLFIVPVLSTLLLGQREGQITLVINILTVLVAGVLESLGIVDWKDHFTHGGQLWMIIGSNFILLNSLITILTGYLIKGLENSITKAQKHMEEISLTQEVTIEGLSTIVEYRDPETGGHILRTQNYVKVLATHLKNTPKYFGKIDQEYIDLLYKSSPLHDIGKVAVPDYILLKTSQLTKSEFEQMKKHTTYGRNALLNVEQKLGDNNFLRYAREMAYSHHEKWDGSGYPLGLQGDNIPLSGRIMAIADVYDALISRRVYKAPLPHETAVDLIKENRGKHFDPDLVDAFVQNEERIRQIAIQYSDPIEPTEDLPIAK